MQANAGNCLKSRASAQKATHPSRLNSEGGSEHDNVNVLCMGAWVIGPKLAEDVVKSYLNARFASEDPDLRRRVEKLQEMDKK